MDIVNIAFPPYRPEVDRVDEVATVDMTAGCYDLAFDGDLRRRSPYGARSLAWFLAGPPVTTWPCASNRTNQAWDELAHTACAQGDVGRYLMQRFVPAWDANERSVKIAIGKLRRALTRSATSPRGA